LIAEGCFHDSNSTHPTKHHVFANQNTREKGGAIAALLILGNAAMAVFEAG
jgi:hypothetical protein